ncbi:predicted protein [Histoplasma capsulatum var. duboisii H88]|uniref:Predicted protein n=1 Tax=Ajellomyces capsulatus (strain H88) TaxID=544711 RepID=F0URK1_AJEC8|nr:predicted protein [Histoplasma capsulatum var. duboisii H88]
MSILSQLQKTTATANWFLTPINSRENSDWRIQPRGNNCAGMFTVALVCHSGGDHNEAWYEHPIYYATKSPKPATPRGSSANTQTQASVHEGFDSRTLRLCFLWLPNNGATQHEIQPDVLGGERSGIPPLSIRRQEC